MPFIHDDDMVQQVPPTTADPSLRNSVLPRTSKGRPYWPASHVLGGRDYIPTKFRVAIEQQESLSGRVRPCFSHLLHDPGGIRIPRHVETQNLSPVVPNDEKAVQHAKRDGWDGKEVHRCDRCTMVSEKRQPTLSRVSRSRSSTKPAGNRWLRHIESQLQQLTMNPGRSPSWILLSHSKDQRSHLRADTSSPPNAAGS